MKLITVIKRWTPEEDAALIRDTHLSRTMTDLEFGCLVGRSASAVRQRRQRLLRPAVTRAAKQRQMATRPPPHPNQPRWHAKYYIIGGAYSDRSRERWEEWEEKLILSPNRPPDRDIAKRLSRTVKSIHARRYQLRQGGSICHPRSHPLLDLEALREAA